jgi:dGTP triphosphohydrolase
MDNLPENKNNLHPGGAASYQSGMEARVAVLEEIARNTVKVLDRIEANIARMDDKLEASIAKLDQKLEVSVAKLDDKMMGMEARMDQRMKELGDRLDGRMGRMEDRMTRLENRQVTDIRWVMGIGIGFGGFIWASMAHGFHWF